jgi:heat-inducible transcriptional repressor
MAPQKKQREEREKIVLIGLVELYLMTGKPVGSNTLKEHGFDHISSATIRNYFAKLESEGFLRQQHISGGRIPTSSAYKYYAQYHAKATDTDPKDVLFLRKGLSQDTREIARYLQHATELLSDVTQSAIFLSSPRFDQDFILDIKLISIDPGRYLCVLVTDFGLVHTEVLYSEKKLSSFALKRIEKYFHFRMTGLERPKIGEDEEALAAHFYNEILLRHIVGHSNFTAEDIYKTGFSKLLKFSEFRDAGVLATGLSLFEDTAYMRALLQKCMKHEDLTFWIGDDLRAGTSHSSIIAAPYFIHGKAVGAVALLGPTRMPYPKMFGIMRAFSAILSEILARNLYKYKITYRQPRNKELDMQTESTVYLSQAQHLLLEDQS